jgi:hypothetical protein
MLTTLRCRSLFPLVRKKFDPLQVAASREGESGYEIELISHGSCGTYGT